MVPVPKKTENHEGANDFKKVTALAISCLSYLADAAIVDAGRLVSVTVEVPLYDNSLSDSNGCDPADCIGGLTRVNRIATKFASFSRSH